MPGDHDVAVGELALDGVVEAAVDQALRVADVHAAALHALQLQARVGGDDAAEVEDDARVVDAVEDVVQVVRAALDGASPPVQSRSAPSTRAWRRGTPAWERPMVRSPQRVRASMSRHSSRPPRRRAASDRPSCPGCRAGPSACAARWRAAGGGGRPGPVAVVEVGRGPALRHLAGVVEFLVRADHVHPEAVHAPGVGVRLALRARSRPLAAIRRPSPSDHLHQQPLAGQVGPPRWLTTAAMQLRPGVRNPVRSRSS